MNLVLHRTGDNIWEVSTDEDIEENVIVTIMRRDEEWYIDFDSTREEVLDINLPF